MIKKINLIIPYVGLSVSFVALFFSEKEIAIIANGILASLWVIVIFLDETN